MAHIYFQRIFVREATKKSFFYGSAIKEGEGVKAVPLRGKKNFLICFP